MQISRQSADSQQASRMPQSMSHGRSQSPHSSEAQQQQKHESSPAQEPQVAQSSTMLHRVRNSQNRQARMQWTQQSGGKETRSRSGLHQIILGNTLCLTILRLGGNLGAVALGAALAPLAALGRDGRVGLQLLSVPGSRRGGRRGGRAASREGAQLRVLVKAPVPDPIGLEGVCVRRGRVMWTVCLRGPSVSVVLGSVALLAAGLRPTRLGVMDRSWSGCWLGWRHENKETDQEIYSNLEFKPSVIKVNVQSRQDNSRNACPERRGCTHLLRRSKMLVTNSEMKTQRWLFFTAQLETFPVMVPVKIELMCNRNHWLLW